MKPSIDIRVHHFSHETFGAQFLIGRTRGDGGQVAFLRTSPKKALKLKLYDDDDDDDDKL